MQEGAEGATSEVREADLEEDSMVTEARVAAATTALTEEAEAGLVAAGGDPRQMETSEACPEAAWAAEAETRAGGMVAVAAEGGDRLMLMNEITKMK